MDGLSHSLACDDGIGEIATGWQQTLKAPISCVGVGLHSGQRVSMTLRQPLLITASYSAVPILAWTSRHDSSALWTRGCAPFWRMTAHGSARSST